MQQVVPTTSWMPACWAKIAQYTTSVAKRALHTHMHAHTMDFTSLSPLWTLCSLWVLCACVCEPKCIIDVSPPGTDDADQSLWCGNTVAALTLTRREGGWSKKPQRRGEMSHKHARPLHLMTVQSAVTCSLSPPCPASILLPLGLCHLR